MNIVDSIAEKLKIIDGQGDFLSDIGDNVSPRLKFWDEVEEFPAIHLNAGAESRQYQGGGYKDRFLAVTVRIYVEEEDAQLALSKLLEDVETVLEDNSQLEYFDNLNNSQKTQQISIVSITTDEGVLEPLGVAEMEIEVRY
jgi:hypothetical protein